MNKTQRIDEKSLDRGEGNSSRLPFFLFGSRLAPMIGEG
jgi:hypothetical protein